LFSQGRGPAPRKPLERREAVRKGRAPSNTRRSRVLRKHCSHRKRSAVHTHPVCSRRWTSSVRVDDGPGSLPGARVGGRGGLHRLAGLEDSFVLVSRQMNHARIRASWAISSFGSVRVHSLAGVPWTVCPGPCNASMLSLESFCRRAVWRLDTRPASAGRGCRSVPVGSRAPRSWLGRPPRSSTWPVRLRRSCVQSSAWPRAGECRPPGAGCKPLSRDDRPWSDEWL